MRNNSHGKCSTFATLSLAVGFSNKNYMKMLIKNPNLWRQKQIIGKKKKKDLQLRHIRRKKKKNTIETLQHYFQINI